LKKGSLVFVEGRLKTDKYEDKGEMKYFTKVVVQTLQFLDKRTAEEPMLSVDEAPLEYDAGNIGE
jgi:single-stranded DNA-binding protein